MKDMKKLLSERLKKYLEENNLQQKELAKILSTKLGEEISLTAINSWVLGKKEPREKVRSILFDLLEISIADYETMFKGVELVRFPVLGRVACGEPIWAEEDKDCYIMADADLKEKYKPDFVLFCKGDSMQPLIKNGDIVFVKKQDSVRNGEIAVVIIDNEATLKRVYQEQDKITLVAINPAYPPIVILASDNKDIRICGKAVFNQTILN